MFPKTAYYFPKTKTPPKNRFLGTIILRIKAGKALILLHFLTVSQKHYNSPKTQIFRITMFLGKSQHHFSRPRNLSFAFWKASIKFQFYCQKRRICKALSVKKDPARLLLQGQFFYCGLTNWVLPRTWALPQSSPL